MSKAIIKRKAKVQPDPTAQPAQPDPTAQPAQTDPTAQPAQTDPTALAKKIRDEQRKIAQDAAIEESRKRFLQRTEHIESLLRRARAYPLKGLDTSSDMFWIAFRSAWRDVHDQKHAVSRVCEVRTLGSELFRFYLVKCGEAISMEADTGTYQKTLSAKVDPKSGPNLLSDFARVALNSKGHHVVSIKELAFRYDAKSVVARDKRPNAVFRKR